MTPQVTLIHYTLTQTADNNNNCYFLAYIEQDNISKLTHILPVSITDELISISVIVPSDKRNTIGDILSERLTEILKRVWKFKYGIPAFFFNGQTNKLLDCYKWNRAVFVFFLNADKNLQDQITAWETALTLCTKYTFVAFEPSAIRTTQHKVAMTWLSQFTEQPTRTPVKPNKTKELMHNWYSSNNLDVRLQEEADDVISSFVFARNYDKEIEGYLVVPVYHVKRYEKALKVLTELYNPAFIMSLPLTLESQSFTILFPVVKDA